MLYLKNWLKTYFGFTKREYNGLLGLIGIIIIVTLLPYLYETFFINNKSISVEKMAIQKLALVNEEHKNNYDNIRDGIEGDNYKTNISYFNFDPNQIDAAQWQKLGLSLKQAQSIINYRNKGGKFYKPEDLQKMYAISPQKYKQLAPYITINNNNQYKNSSFTKAPFIKKELPIIEVNTADTLLLDEIKGIGAAFARRIVKYRDRLGGFYKKEQLLEVYGLDSVKFAEIKDQIKIDATVIKKINVNTAEFQDLRSNPYLNYKQVNAIIQYRKQHGNYNDINDLRKILILNPQTIQNLTPYLSF